MRILDALFVGRDPDSGDMIAVSMSTDSTAGMIGRLLSFRLDDHERQTTTQRALDCPAGPVVRSLGAKLEPGEADQLRCSSSMLRAVALDGGDRAARRD